MPFSTLTREVEQQMCQLGISIYLFDNLPDHYPLLYVYKSATGLRAEVTPANLCRPCRPNQRKSAAKIMKKFFNEKIFADFVNELS